MLEKQVTLSTTEKVLEKQVTLSTNEKKIRKREISYT
jgi:hypothetical protein